MYIFPFPDAERFVGACTTSFEPYMHENRLIISTFTFETVCIVHTRQVLIKKCASSKCLSLLFVSYFRSNYDLAQEQKYLRKPFGFVTALNSTTIQENPTVVDFSRNEIECYT